MKTKREINAYAKFSTIAIQMAAIIAGGTYGGVKLDEYLQNEYLFTLIFSLSSVILSMYLAIKDVINFPFWTWPWTSWPASIRFSEWDKENVPENWHIQIFQEYWWIGGIFYILFTLTEALLLSFGGMSIFDAINHSFTTMATGGYSTKQASVAAWDSPYIQYVITIFTNILNK